MAPRKKDVKMQELLENLRSWSLESDLVNNPIIRQLTNDIELGNNLHVWADLNPTEYLPETDLTANTKRVKRIALITGIRNVLVFTPVALTWMAISVVTAAFSRYESENPDSIINFLDFWQLGYGYINDFWRLSNVAIFDVILIVVVILLTLGINIFTRINLDFEIKEYSRFMTQKNLLVIQLTEFLYPYKHPTLNQINKNVYITTKNLEKSITNLNKIISRLEKDIKNYPSSTKIVAELKNINQTMKKISK